MKSHKINVLFGLLAAFIVAPVAAGPICDFPIITLGEPELLSSIEEDQDVADFSLLAQGTCESDRFAMIFEDGSGPPDWCLFGQYCILRANSASASDFVRSGDVILSVLPLPPTPAFLNCTSWPGGGNTCTVWPQGDLHFSWSVSSNLTTQHPPSWSGPTQEITCGLGGGTGWVSVSITTPDGASDTAFHAIACGGQVIR